MSKISVFIVDDHQVVIEGIKSLFQNEETITVTGSATTANKCIQFLKMNMSNIILMDINLPPITMIKTNKKSIKF